MSRLSLTRRQAISKTYVRRKLTDGLLRKSLAARPLSPRDQSASMTEIHLNPTPAIRKEIVALAMPERGEDTPRVPAGGDLGAAARRRRIAG
jgi:hypothetical protein